MSKPFTEYECPISGAISEIISGNSALHCPPEPIPKSEQDDESGFLSDTDYMVRHALEHYREAVQQIRKCFKYKRLLEEIIRFQGTARERGAVAEAELLIYGHLGDLALSEEAQALRDQQNDK